MRKIGVISDVHGNIQALQVALDYLKSQNCEEIIHTGDIADIGANCLECFYALVENNVVCILGNHDLDFLRRDAFHRPRSHVSGAHKKYVFDKLEPARGTIKNFPMSVVRFCGGKKIVFEHYCRLQHKNKYGHTFKVITEFPTAKILDRMYSKYDCDAVFFGHKHEPCDIVGQKLYVDVGSVGCHPEPLACGIVISFDDTHFEYERFALPYKQNDTKLAMTDGNLPDGDYLFNFYYLHNDLPHEW